MLFYFEFSCIQMLLNIHMNKLLFYKLISNTIYIYIYMFACTGVNVISNITFALLKSDLAPRLILYTVSKICHCHFQVRACMHE